MTAPAISSVRARDGSASIQPPPVTGDAEGESEQQAMAADERDRTLLTEVQLLSGQVERAMGDRGRIDALQQQTYRNTLELGELAGTVHQLSEQMVEDRRGFATATGRLQIAVDKMNTSIGALGERTKFDRWIQRLCLLSISAWVIRQLVISLGGG